MSVEKKKKTEKKISTAAIQEEHVFSFKIIAFDKIILSNLVQCYFQDISLDWLVPFGHLGSWATVDKV